VAEGVETKAQLEHLKHDGCDEVPGYLVSRASPAAGLRQFFENRRIDPKPTHASIEVDPGHEPPRLRPGRNWLPPSKDLGRDARIFPKTSALNGAATYSGVPLDDLHAPPSL